MQVFVKAVYASRDHSVFQVSLGLALGPLTSDLEVGCAINLLFQ